MSLRTFTHSLAFDTNVFKRIIRTGNEHLFENLFIHLNKLVNPSCSDTIWDSQRRTHVLSNDNVIWDFAGNVWEWVKDNNSSSQGANDYSSTFNSGDSRQTNYGNDTFCVTPSASPYCGMGYG